MSQESDGWCDHRKPGPRPEVSYCECPLPNVAYDYLDWKGYMRIASGTECEDCPCWRPKEDKA